MGLFDDYSIGDYSLDSSLGDYSFADSDSWGSFDWDSYINPGVIDLSNSDYFTDGRLSGGDYYDLGFDDSLFSNFNVGDVDLGSLWDYTGGSLDPLSDEYTPFQLEDYTVDGNLKDLSLIDLSNSDYTLDGMLLPESTDSGSSSGSSMAAINKLLSSLLGGAKSATDSPLGKLAQLYLANEAKKKALSNQKSARNNAVAMAQGNSQQAMTGNRRAPYTVQQRDPSSYVAQAPLIKDR